MSAHTATIRAATIADIPAAAATLSAAFSTYPWTRWSIPEENYDARLEQLQSIYLAHALEHGLVFVTRDLAGVVAVLPPHSPEPAAAIQTQVAALMGERLETVFGVALPDRPANSWDLATIGVRPERAGTGLGSALIAEALRRIAESEYPRVSLETSAESNVALYERHGFAVTHHTQITDGPTVWTMSIDL